MRPYIKFALARVRGLLPLPTRPLTIDVAQQLERSVAGREQEVAGYYCVHDGSTVCLEVIANAPFNGGTVRAIRFY